MNKFFDKEKWEQIIKKPDWYLNFSEEKKKFENKKNQMTADEWAGLRKSVAGFFEESYIKGELALGEKGPNWDEERKEVDTVVVHHTSGSLGMRWQTISTIHLLNIYANYYSNPEAKDAEIKGWPIYSGHFRDDKQVFYGYHWIVRNDGSAERLLNDDEIGWHAGNWDINIRSVGIVLDGDFSDDAPSQPMLESMANLIREKYPQVSKERIFGHREVKQNGSTECPGNSFLSSENKSGWKADLIDKI